MRFKVDLELIEGNFDNSIKHHTVHSKAIASWIYGILGENDVSYARLLHDRGISVGKGKKTVKPFVFSRIFQRNNHRVLKIASNDPKFVFNLTQGFGSNDILRLPGNVVFRASWSSIAHNPIIEETDEEDVFTTTVFTLSPVVIRRADGSYHIAKDGESEEINESLRINLSDKYFAVKGTHVKEPHLRVSMKNMRVLRIPFNGETKKQYNEVIAHNGQFTLTGSFELLRTAIYAGMGSKNSLGFGFIERHNGHSE